MILVCKYWFKIAYESDSKLYAFDTQLTVHNFIRYIENTLKVDFQIGEEYAIEIVESEINEWKKIENIKNKTSDSIVMKKSNM